LLRFYLPQCVTVKTIKNGGNDPKNSVYVDALIHGMNLVAVLK
jgi:hypothetical protein